MAVVYYYACILSFDVVYCHQKGVAAMAQVSLRVDDDVKRGAEQALSDIGLSMSTAINVFLRKVARERRIPFELTADMPNTETIEAIQEVRRMKANPGLGKTYTNVDQMMEELLADV